MKILAVAFNYREHQSELVDLAVVQDEPIIFHKGDSLLRPGYPLYLPDWSQQIDYEGEIVVQIDRVGKNIAERFAHRYYSKVSVGIDFTARDWQRKAKSEGLPWSIAKSFEGSAVVGDWIDKSELGYPENPLSFRLDVDGETRQSATSREMIHSIDHIVAYISQFYTLKMGDIIFTGTPAGIGTCSIGQYLDGYLNDRHILHVPIK